MSFTQKEIFYYRETKNDLETPSIMQNSKTEKNMEENDS
jgi:hypothetical protein